MSRPTASPGKRGFARVPQRRFSGTHKHRRVSLAMEWHSHYLREGIMRYAREAGWIVDASTERVITAFGRHCEDGILAVYTGSDPLLTLLRTGGVPVVNLLGYVVHDPLIPHVGLDLALSARRVAEHFIARGFRNFVFCSDPRGPSRVRREAFLATVTDSGGDAYELNWSAARRRANLKGVDRWSWLVQELIDLPKPVALLGQNDDAAIDVMDACLRAGLHVPEEVAIMGWDNNPQVCEFSPVPLSSLDPDLDGIGYRGAELLDQLMDGAPPPKDPIMLPPKGIVVRQSSNIQAVPHVGVARALVFIADSYSNASLSVGDVAAAVSMSKTGLNHAFRQYLKRPVSGEIRRVRLSHAQNLLANTDRSVADIAAACGYADPQRLRDALKPITGLTPLRYRAKHRS